MNLPFKKAFGETLIQLAYHGLAEFYKPGKFTICGLQVIIFWDNDLLKIELTRRNL